MVTIIILPLMVSSGDNSFKRNRLMSIRLKMKSLSNGLKNSWQPKKILVTTAAGND